MSNEIFILNGFQKMSYWCPKEGEKRSVPCLGHLDPKSKNVMVTPDYNITFYYRNDKIQLDDARAYLAWINENVYTVEYDDEVFWFKPVYINNEYVHKNTVVIFMFIRLLWEGSNTVDFNLKVINSVINGEVSNLEEYLVMYTKYYNKDGFVLNGNHHLLCKAHYNEAEIHFTRTNIVKEDLINYPFKSANDFTKWINEHVMTVYLVGNSVNYLAAIKSAIQVYTMEEADLVLFTGGEDIDPMLYKEKRHKQTYTNQARDANEIQEWEKAQRLNKFCYGICRGSQLLCALSGGKVIQHVTGHTGGSHGVVINDKEYQATSTHHQMMYPYTASVYVVLGKSAEMRSNKYWKNDKEQYDMIEEPEIVWFPDTKCLCVQAHPEYMVGEPFWIETNKLIKKYINEN